MQLILRDVFGHFFSPLLRHLFEVLIVEKDIKASIYSSQNLESVSGHKRFDNVIEGGGVEWVILIDFVLVILC